MSVRSIALRLLGEYEENNTFVNLSLHSHVTDSLSAQDRAFLTELLYSAVERKITLDYLIGAFSGRSAEDVRKVTRDILRLGLCQILFMNSVPDFAAVSETVSLAGNPGEKSFVNGILRTACRSKTNLPFPKREKNLARFLSVTESFPLPLVKDFIARFGAEETEKMLQAVNRKMPLTVFVNETKISRAAFSEACRAAGLETVPTENSPFGVRILTPTPVVLIPGFREGHFFVQDEASQLAVLALSPLAGENVVDVCACPGGKSFAAACMMKNAGHVASFDVHESKISLISEGAERLGLSSVNASVRDAVIPDESRFGTFDRLICDVPCSGFGVFGKKPDLRYKDLSSLGQLPVLQLEILEKSVSYLKPNGVCIYSTCTVRHEENEDTVSAFLAHHPEFVPEPFAVGKYQCPTGMLTIYPHRDGTDGFFIAKLRRIGEHRKEMKT